VYWVLEVGAVVDSMSGASPIYHTTLSGASGKGIEDRRTAADCARLRESGHAAAIAAKTGMLLPDWHGFNVLHTAAARVGGLALGFAQGKNVAQMMQGGVDALWLLGADEFDTTQIGAETFVVYQGHHGDKGAARADVILPGAAYTEKSGTYVSTEGRTQRTQLAVFPPGEAREDWKILRAFSAMIDKPLPYDTLEAIRARLAAVNPIFDRLDILPRFGCGDLTGPMMGAMSNAKFGVVVENYYMTDPISRASQTMAACTEAHAAPIAAE
jgi:NADH-quinone oxidoreductase subunit G